MSDIKFTVTDQKDLDSVAPLWKKLVLHHRERSVHFKKRYDKFTWESRRHDLLQKTSDGGNLRIDLAYDGEDLVGYCVSTVTSAKWGEVDSIYIEQGYRKQGVGTRFMETALAWLHEQGAEKWEIGVAAGNEEAVSFYARFGFHPCVIVLRHAGDSSIQ